MKIIEVAWHIDNKKLCNLDYSYTGGSLVINNLCEFIGIKEDVYVFIGQNELPNIQMGKFEIIQTNDIPKNVLEKNKRISCDNKVQRLLNREYSFMKALLKIQPDIVNFHDIGEMTQRLIEICISNQVEYTVTNHLFIGKKPEFNGYEEWQKLEERFFNQNVHKVVTVSYGEKIKILANYPSYPSELIYPIANGTDYHNKEISLDIRKKYQIGDEKKLLVVSGTIIERKNHKQILSSMCLLEKGIQEKLVIIVCGKGKMIKELHDLVIKLKLESNIIFAGAIEPEDMPSFYNASDGFIMPSFAEGLSIAAIEALTFGKPLILFEDSECFQDLNDDKVICAAKKRTDHSFAIEIKKWFYKEWDANYIKRFANYFSMERMADDYIEYYHNLIGK